MCGSKPNPSIPPLAFIRTTGLNNSIILEARKPTMRVYRHLVLFFLFGLLFRNLGLIYIAA